MDLKDVKDLSHWQIAIAAAGVAIAIAAIAASAKPMVVCGIGIAAFGIGQMRSHPRQESVMLGPYGHVTAKITGHPRSFSKLGIALEALGCLLFFGGLGWYVFS